MRKQALFCDGTAAYVVPPQAEKNEVITLRFRAARGDDLRIRLITAVGGYDMEKERSEGEFDYYGIRWRFTRTVFIMEIRQTMWSQMSIITSADTAGK